VVPTNRDDTTWLESRLAPLLLRMSHTAQPGSGVHERGSTASAGKCVAKKTGAMQFGRSCLNLDIELRAVLCVCVNLWLLSYFL